MIEIDKIYNGDCLCGMKSIPDGSVDLIVTDPPYDLDTRGAGLRKKRDYYDVLVEKGLHKSIDERYLEEMVRIMKAVNIYLFCNIKQVRMYFNFFSQYNCDLLVWHKTNPIPILNNRYLPDLEYIFFARDKGVPLFGEYDTKSKLYQSQVNKQDLNQFGHPTVKPLQLVQKLVHNSSEEGAVVFDPFIGSGTTAVACIREKRHFIGFEIDKDYYDKAVNRIIAERCQLTLF